MPTIDELEAKFPTRKRRLDTAATDERSLTQQKNFLAIETKLPTELQVQNIDNIHIRLRDDKSLLTIRLYNYLIDVFDDYGCI